MTLSFHCSFSIQFDNTHPKSIDNKFNKDYQSTKLMINIIVFFIVITTMNLIKLSVSCVLFLVKIIFFYESYQITHKQRVLSIEFLLPTFRNISVQYYSYYYITELRNEKREKNLSLYISQTRTCLDLETRTLNLFTQEKLKFLCLNR